MRLTISLPDHAIDKLDRIAAFRAGELRLSVQGWEELPRAGRSEANRSRTVSEVIVAAYWRLMEEGGRQLLMPEDELAVDLESVSCSEREFWRHIPKVSGLYLVVDPEDSEIKYVGKSDNMKMRWQSHALRDRCIEQGLRIDIWCAAGVYLDIVEWTLIRLLTPAWNGIDCDTDGGMRYRQRYQNSQSALGSDWLKLDAVVAADRLCVRVALLGADLGR